MAVTGRTGPDVNLAARRAAGRPAGSGGRARRGWWPRGRRRRTAGPRARGRRPAPAGRPPPPCAGNLRIHLFEGGQAGLRPVRLTHRDRAVQPDDRAVGEPVQLVVPLDDLHPVGLVRRPRVGVQGGDRGLRLVLAEPVAGQRRPAGSPRPRRSARCPSGTGPAPPAGRARRRRVVRAARRAWCSSISASRPDASSSSVIERTCRVSRIASSARSTSPL